MTRLCHDVVSIVIDYLDISDVFHKSVAQTKIFSKLKFQKLNVLSVAQYQQMILHSIHECLSKYSCSNYIEHICFTCLRTDLMNCEIDYNYLYKFTDKHPHKHCCSVVTETSHSSTPFTHYSCKSHENNCVACKVHHKNFQYEDIHTINQMIVSIQYLHEVWIDNIRRMF